MRLLALVVVGACGFQGPALDGTGDGGPPIDAPRPKDIIYMDAPIDAGVVNVEAGGCTSFETTLALDTCTLTLTGSGPSMTGDQIYNTDDRRLYAISGGAATGTGTPVAIAVDVAINGVTVDIWPVAGFSLPGGATLRVVGTKPFAIVAAGTITIGSTLDASSGGIAAGSSPTGNGAGASSTDCAGSAGATGGTASSRGAGGGGGSFKIAGGKGGNTSGGGAVGGNPGTTIGAPSPIRSGCPGGSGGTGGGVAGKGGVSGGVILLLAGTKVAVPGGGKINVGGAGGAGGSNVDGGGGGGGSGGMIRIDAPTIELSGGSVLAANGGGGGGGWGGNTAGTGQRGATGQASATAAAGGLPFPTSGPGTAGGGGAAGTATGAAAASTGGGGSGGGGGGGGGYILLTASTLNKGGTLSPP